MVLINIYFMVHISTINTYVHVCFTDSIWSITKILAQLMKVVHWFTVF